MTAETQRAFGVLVGLGVLTAAWVIVPESERVLWGPLVCAVAGFIGLAVAYESPRWFATAVPGYIATTGGLYYSWLHWGERAGVLALVATIAFNLLVVVYRQRRSRLARSA